MFVTRALLTILFVLNVYAWLSFVAEEDEKIGVTSVGSHYATDPPSDDGGNDDGGNDDSAGSRRLLNEDFFFSLHHSGVCAEDDPDTISVDEGKDLNLADCEAVLYEDFNPHDAIFNLDSNNGDSFIAVVATSAAYDTYVHNINSADDFMSVKMGKYGESVGADTSTYTDVFGLATGTDYIGATSVNPKIRDAVLHLTDTNQDLFSQLYPVGNGAVGCNGKLKVEVTIDNPAAVAGTTTPELVKTDFELVLVKGKQDGSGGSLTVLTIDTDASAWTAGTGAAAAKSTASLSFSMPRFAEDACISYKSNNVHTGDWAAAFYDGASDIVTDAAECSNLKCSDEAPCYCNSRDELNDVRHVFDIITSTGNTASSFVGLAYELCAMAGNLPMFLFIWVALPSSSYLVFSTYTYTNRHYADWWDPFSTNNNGLMGLIGITFIYVVFYSFVLVLRSNSTYRDRAVDIVRAVMGERSAEALRSVVDDDMVAPARAPAATRSIEMSRGNRSKNFKAAAVSGAANL